MGYIRPVLYTGISSWTAHKRRVPPSQEAGVDYYCPIGSMVHAPAGGRVYQVAGGIAPATGRFVTIDLDDGRRVRYLHLLRQLVREGERVTPGQVIGISGASGYGSEFFGASTFEGIPKNTGGPHTHVTLWPTHAYSFGVNATTLDFEAYASSSAPAGGGNTSEEDELNADDKAWMRLMIQQEIEGVKNTIGGMDARLKLVEGAVARFPGDGSVVPRTDDVAAWVALARDDIARVDQKVTALGAD